MKYHIKDWASNICFGGERFDSFEDAWGFIYDALRDEIDQDEKVLDEFYVEEVTK